MFTASLYIGILFILSGFAFFGYAAYLRQQRKAEMAKSGEPSYVAVKGTARSGIFNIVAFGAIAIGSLLFSLGYFSQVYAERVDVTGSAAPAPELRESAD